MVCEVIGIYVVSFSEMDWMVLPSKVIIAVLFLGWSVINQLNMVVSSLRLDVYKPGNVGIA